MQERAEHLLRDAINTVRSNKGLNSVKSLEPDQDLRADLSLDSLDLAELTVRLEAQSGIDVFAAGLVNTVGEVRQRLAKLRNGND
jgi:acyl carrier protein